MASQSMVTLFSAFFVACVVGVTFAYPSNIQEILEHENAENTARIEKVLSHFSPEEPQQYDKDIEVRTYSSYINLFASSLTEGLVASLEFAASGPSSDLEKF